MTHINSSSEHSREHRQELAKTERHILGHIAHNDSRSAIYEEVNRLRTEDTRHGLNFHQDLQYLNRHLKHDLAKLHLPNFTLHDRDGAVEAGEHTHSSKPFHAAHSHFPSAVQHAFATNEHRHFGRNQGRFVPPPNWEHQSETPSKPPKEFSNNSDAAPSKSGFAEKLLNKLGLPVTQANLEFMDAWQKAEGGSADNPFNTSQNAAGSISINGDGVRRYPSIDEGVDATAQTLENGYYNGILDALKQGDNAHSSAVALAQTRWGTGSLVAKMV